MKFPEVVRFPTNRSDDQKEAFHCTSQIVRGGIQSSMDLTHVGGPSPSASKERKPGGVGGRRKYNDDKYTDGAHLIDSAKVFSEDAWDVVRKRWKVTPSTLTTVVPTARSINELSDIDGLHNDPAEVKYLGLHINQSELESPPG
ncbi:hypothetical protein F2P81_007241 [Scophthalmus maximus]|uniref:Uncharacterized protein n=1 Tax=Scophthalmus maximus TaxID=52904 RepID=A0A6A4T5T6_SCOMX|nr:hypothetical protein F2P81_007241 [Scophthalmus maximus]